MPTETERLHAALPARISFAFSPITAFVAAARISAIR
jgi:hypothetical protein